MNSSEIISSLTSVSLSEFIPFWDSNSLLLGKHVHIARIRSLDRVELLRALEQIIDSPTSLVVFPTEGQGPKCLADLSINEIIDAAFFRLEEGETSLILSDQDAFISLKESLSAENEGSVLSEMINMVYLGSLEALAANALSGFMWLQSSTDFPNLILLDHRSLYSSSLKSVTALKRKIGKENKAKLAEAKAKLAEEKSKAEEEAKNKAREEKLRSLALRNVYHPVSVRNDLLVSESERSDGAEGVPTSDSSSSEGEMTPPPQKKSKNKLTKGGKSAHLKSSVAKKKSALDVGDSSSGADDEEDLDEVSLSFSFSLDFLLFPPVCS
jgi:hypothetical protein